MLYDSTKVLLRGILESLQCAGKIRWDEQMELASECSYEMHQLARPPFQSGRTERISKAPVVPVFQKAERAIPHVKLMARAIRRQDQEAAVQSGKAALAEL